MQTQRVSEDNLKCSQSERKKTCVVFVEARAWNRAHNWRCTYFLDVIRGNAYVFGGGVTGEGNRGVDAYIVDAYIYRYVYIYRYIYIYFS